MRWIIFLSRLDDGSKLPLQQTHVRACYDSLYFHARYDCDDNNIYSSYTQCNDPLFNQVCAPHTHCLLIIKGCS